MPEHTPKSCLSKVIADDGAADFAAAVALEDMLAACAETGKPGKLVVTLSFKPDRQNGGILTIAHKATIPTGNPSARIVYVGAQGEVLDDNPNQPMLPITTTIKTGIKPQE